MPIEIKIEQMNKIVSKLIKFAIDKAKQNKTIQNIFEQPIDLNKFSVKAEFKDTHAQTHVLYNGLKSKIKPGWEKMFEAKAHEIAQIQPDYNHLKTHGFSEFNRLKNLVEIVGLDLTKTDVLEIGCHSGAASYAIAESGAKTVTAIDFYGYKAKSASLTEDSTDFLVEVDKNISQIRSDLKSRFLHSDKVRFFDDDICHSKLESEQFNLILSWDVLEHISDPESALKEMYRLLKPGGFAIHEYNPFFCLNGGHSPCTLDFLWGHVQLNSGDFERYQNEISPDLKTLSMAFYNEGLNRMTISDLKQYSQNAGLELQTLISFPKEQHLKMLNSSILQNARRNYPTVSISDMVSPRIVVILQKR